MSLTPGQRQSITWLALSLVAALLLWLLAPVLTPFIVAAVLAYALEPAVGWLVKRRVPRPLAVFIVELVAIIVALAILLLIVPILSKQIPQLQQQIPLLADRINTGLGPLLQRFGINASIDVNSIKTFVLKYLNANLEDWLTTALSSARIGGSYLLAVVGNAVLIPMVLFYLLLDWPKLVLRLHELVPPRLRATVDSFMAECDATLGQYLRGQLLVMLVLAAYYSIGLMVAGFDLGLPVGIFTGLLVFIPYVGFGLGLVLALVAALLQFGSWYGFIAVAVVYGVGQVLESFFLTPRLVGERIGMNALTVIFALLAFGHLFGFVGVLIALPVSAVLKVAAGRLQAVYFNSRLFNG